MSRPETGPMQFGDDWRGIFVRGDDAMMLAFRLNHLLELVKPMTGVHMDLIRTDMIYLQRLLEAASERGSPHEPTQRLLPWEDCQVPK